MATKNDLVKVYDDMFNLIGTEKWSVVHEKGLLHQVVHLWMYGDEPDGRWLYFIQRSKNLDLFPGLYDLPISGHIDPEETFSETIVSLTKEHLGLILKPELLQHVGNIHQVIDQDNYHDNAFCQVYVKNIYLPVPDFEIHNVEMLFKTKYDDFCKWVEHPEGTIALYTPNGEFIKDSDASEWWWPRKEEFLTIVKPYIDKQN
ncbi:NUDIX domain-containing protein [Frisingicoccus sp.]|uniref:NUDIX hydrolase n=1 Tax=Frisingicoccus sp. TaxID=1918627 RepID=UPI002ECBF378|nr:NUDIX domain-containing protein [Frisingicoccus sp.]